MYHSVVSQNKVWEAKRVGLLEKFLRKFIFSDTIMPFAQFCRLKAYKAIKVSLYPILYSAIFRSNKISLGGTQKSTSVSHRQAFKLAGHLLAFPILQVEMRIEVDEDPLVRTRRRYHPCTSLRGRIGHGVSGRGEVVGG